MLQDRDIEVFFSCLLTAPLKQKLFLATLLLITGFFPVTLKWMNDAAEREEREEEKQRMAKPWFERLAYPVTDPHYRIKLVEAGKCPQCGTDLDTGWECTDYRKCGFDARPLAYPHSRNPDS